MVKLDSPAASLLVVAALLYAPAFVLPKWSFSESIIGPDVTHSLGIWQRYICLRRTPSLDDAYRIGQMVSACLALLTLLIALFALVPYITRAEGQQIRTPLIVFTVAAILTAVFIVVEVALIAPRVMAKKAVPSYNVGLSVLSVILWMVAGLLGACKSCGRC